MRENLGDKFSFAGKLTKPPNWILDRIPMGILGERGGE